MRLYNYTSLKKRDTKIYNVGGYNIAGGLSIDFLVITAPVAIVIIILGAIIGAIFGISFFNPFSEDFHLAYTLIWIAAGVGIGMGLYKIQFAGYRLYQYLLAYMKPKKVYVQEGKKIKEYKLTNVKINTFVRNIC